MTGFELYAYFVILSEAKNLILTQSNSPTNQNFNYKLPQGVNAFGMQNLKIIKDKITAPRGISLGVHFLS